MQTRFEGVLSQWDDARGFGFITPSAGGEVVFAHISAFPRMTQRPAIGLHLSFEVEAHADGKKRARQIRLSATVNSQPGVQRQAPQRSKPRHIPVLLLLIAVMIGSWAYQHYQASGSTESQDDWVPVRQNLQQSDRDLSTSEPPAQAYRCDGRTHCSQMRSCAEAKFFLDHCPNVKMDGNHDGIPCEQQWCTGPLSN